MAYCGTSANNYPICPDPLWKLSQVDLRPGCARSLAGAQALSAALDVPEPKSYMAATKAFAKPFTKPASVFTEARLARSIPVLRRKPGLH